MTWRVCRSRVLQFHLVKEAASTLDKTQVFLLSFRPNVLGMLSSSPSNTPARPASPAFPAINLSTPDYSGFATLQKSLSSSLRTSQPHVTQPYNPPFMINQDLGTSSAFSSTEDEFGTFSSAVADPQSNFLTLSNSTNLKITLEAKRLQQGIVELNARFSNKQPSQIDEFTFQMAVPKVNCLSILSPKGSQWNSPWTLNRQGH